MKESSNLGLVSLCNAGFPFLFFTAVFPRQCYRCYPASTHSYEDCDSKRFRVTCSTSQHCVKASAYTTSGIKQEAYVKGCAKTCEASDIPVCNHPHVKCEVHCCSSDFCNAASGPVVSGLLLVVAANFIHLLGF